MREVAPSGPGNERQVGKRAGWPHARTSSGGVRATARKADLGQGGALSLKYSEITPGTKLREQVTRRSLGERSARVIGPTQVGRSQDPRPPCQSRRYLKSGSDAHVFCRCRGTVPSIAYNGNMVAVIGGQTGVLVTPGESKHHQTGAFRARDRTDLITAIRH